MAHNLWDVAVGRTECYKHSGQVTNLRLPQAKATFPATRFFIAAIFLNDYSDKCVASTIYTNAKTSHKQNLVAPRQRRKLCMQRPAPRHTGDKYKNRCTVACRLRRRRRSVEGPLQISAQRFRDKNIATKSRVAGKESRRFGGACCTYCCCCCSFCFFFFPAADCWVVGQWFVLWCLIHCIGVI